jgi:hypothetical protein
VGRVRIWEDQDDVRVGMRKVGGVGRREVVGQGKGELRGSEWHKRARRSGNSK